MDFEGMNQMFWKQYLRKQGMEINLSLLAVAHWIRTSVESARTQKRIQIINRQREEVGHYTYLR